MNNIVEMKNISKSYDGKRFVLKELDFCLQTGEIATIYGASGSGKSTLLNCMGFLDRFNEGEYRFNGQAIDVKRINNYTQYRASDIGFIFQAYSLIEGLSVEENIKMPFMYIPGRTVPGKAEMQDILDRLQLSGLRAEPAGRLSGGEKQRVAIARALIKKPKLIIADEPTGNLDDGNSKAVAEAFRDIAKSGTSIVVVTHNRNIEFGEGNKYSLDRGRLYL